MEPKDYKRHIEELAKMNNPPVSQCIALLRQLYGKLVNREKEDIFEIRIPNLHPDETEFVRDSIKGFTKDLLNKLTARRKSNP